MDLSRLNPLVWEDNKYPHLCVAETSFGHYYVAKTPSDKPWNHGKYASYWPIGDVMHGTSIEHGKQLAEADYRHRVAGLFDT